MTKKAPTAGVGPCGSGTAWFGPSRAHPLRHYRAWV